MTGGCDKPGHALRRNAVVAILFAALALAFVGPALLPGRALLPIDALFGYPPWQAHADNFGVTLPNNPLIADAILQNYSWKRLARESFARGELPLWNPYILAGQPFMASGQNGSLYPLGILFYVLPLASAYGWFIALHLWIGALGAYWLARTLGATRLGGVVSGITFGFCGYLVVSFLWPMVVSTAVWLPTLLAVIEGQCQAGPRRAVRPVALGGLVVGLQFLAGHLEMSLYLLLTAGMYTAFRLIGRLRVEGFPRPALDGLVALAMVALAVERFLEAFQAGPNDEVMVLYGMTVLAADLRARGLDENLAPHELGRALFHLNQRRGFKSNRRADRRADGQRRSEKQQPLPEPAHQRFRPLPWA